MTELPAKTGARLLVDALAMHGATRVFCVPGESYLPVLDALLDTDIQVVTARQEGGAAMMAEAHGKLTGQPGICMVTRGPGATNASAGVHVAAQDSTPLLLFIGHVGSDAREREAFQEIDYRAMFGTIAKWVIEIDRADRVPELISRAFHVATSGRPGPVVIALPEDMLAAVAEVDPGARYSPARSGPNAESLDAIAHSLSRASKPLIVVGGGGWSREAQAGIETFATAWNIPVAAAWRCQDFIDNRLPIYAGHLGLGANPPLAARVREADWVMLLGTRMEEIPSGDYSYLAIPKPSQFLVHVHQDPEELGRVYRPDIGVVSAMAPMAKALAALEPKPGDWSVWRAQARADYEAHLAPTQSPGPMQMAEVIRHLDATLPDDAILTNGAGNYAIWPQRFFRFRGYKTQLAPQSGSMGYGLPAAIAAKLEYPNRTVIAFAGDGCFEMTCQELGTAAQSGAHVIVIVVNNGTYGTIRMHQERHFPGRVSATDIVNPDFVALAQAYGAHAERITETSAFAPAFDRAQSAKRLALIEIVLDAEALTPAQSLSQIRAAASRK